MAGLEDLAQFLVLNGATKQRIAENDPYVGGSQIGSSLLNVVAGANNYPTKDRIVAAAISGLLGGVFGGMSDSYRSRAGDAYQSIIANSLMGNSTDERPSVLSPTLFSDAKSRGSIFSIMNSLKKKELDDALTRETTLQNIKDQNDLNKAITVEAFKNPRLMRQFLGAAGATGSGTEESIVQPKALPDSKKIDPVKRFNELIDATGDEDVAKSILTSEIEQQGKEKGKIEDYISKLQESVTGSNQRLSDIGLALQGAGQTGGFYGEETGRGVNLAIQDLFGGDEAEARRGARKDLESLNLLEAGEIRKLFPGSVSIPEMQMYLRGGIGLNNTPEGNKAIFDRLSRGVALNQQQIDFLNEAKERGYSLADAQRLYGKFDQLVPMLKNGELNPQRESIDFSQLPFDALENGTLQINQPEQAPIVQEPVAAPESGESDVGYAARGALNAGAQFGNTALFGIPKKLVAGAQTAGKEIADLFGYGEGKSLSQNYNESADQIQGALDAGQKEFPILTGGGQIAGAFFSPANKLKAVKSIYSMAGAKGVAARAGLAGATAAVQNAGEKGSLTDKVENAGLLSAGLDLAVKGLGKTAGAAGDVFKKLIGITSQNYREASKGLSKTALTEAKNRFQRALTIVDKEKGINYKDLLGSDENVMQDIASKAQESIKSRNDEIDKIVGYADWLLKQDGKGVVVKPTQLRAAAKANDVTDGDKILKEGMNIYNKFAVKFGGKGAPLSAIQATKKQLNKKYDAGSSYNDAVTALADDFRTTIETTINDLVKKGRLPEDLLDKVRKINLEERDLMKLRDAMASKLPGAMAQDILSTGQKALYTTGSAGIGGASAIGQAAGGERGQLAAIATALTAYSKRLGRPVAKALADNEVADFLASPEFRNAATQFQAATDDEGPLPDFSMKTSQPNAEATRNLFSIGSQKKNLTGSNMEDIKKQPVVLEKPAQDDFDTKVVRIADELGADPEHLLSVMKFETGGELKSNTKNKAGSGATGLIQFMPATAKDLTGADSKEAAIKILSDMSEVEQLDYVKKYLQPFKGKLDSVDDLYMAILYPKAVGKDSNYVLFREGTKAYWQNRGLDIDEDGVITKEEASSKVKAYQV